MDGDNRRVRSRSFGPAAELYDRIRPGYPLAALRWALGVRPLGVIDLGAGTGILTRQLVAAGHRVTAVEPDAEMRARLERASGMTANDGITALDGTAEAIPLPDASVDAVLAGQAYHWFDRDHANREIARVLRPGGWFVPIWNIRDESRAWLRELSVLADGKLARSARGGEGGGSDPGLSGHAFDEWFGPVERAEFGHSTTLTADTLVDLVRSRSYYLTASAEQRAVVEAGVRELAGTHPDLAGRVEFELPYRTIVYRAQRLG